MLRDYTFRPISVIGMTYATHIKQKLPAKAAATVKQHYSAVAKSFQHNKLATNNIHQKTDFLTTNQYYVITAPYEQLAAQ